MSDRSVVRGRACAGCTLCCKLISVAAVEKPRDVWCRHCDPKAGCAIYGERPDECRTFLCGYLIQEQLGEHWYPKKSRMVVIDRVEATGSNITVFVDSGSPAKWREPLYYQDIKHWARTFPPEQVQILVIVGDKVTLVLPDKDLDLGIVQADQVVVTRATPTPGGIFYDAVVMAKDDPRVATIPQR